MARLANERPILPMPQTSTVDGVIAFAATLVRLLGDLLTDLAFRTNRTLPKDGSEAMTAPLPLKSYTSATRPAAADYAGALIYVSDAAAGSKLQYSDGTSWVAAG